jgi:hypothetical protein
MKVAPKSFFRRDSVSHLPAGLALALVRKAAIVVWTSIGLLVLTWRTLPNAWRRIP